MLSANGQVQVKMKWQKKQSAKQKRACKGEQITLEKRICEKGHEQLHDLEYKEYNNMQKN